MCKILMLTDGSRLDTKQLHKFLGYSNLALCARERDGFGWAALGTKGVFGERYVKPNDFDFRIAKKAFNLPISVKNANSFGQLSKVKGAVIAHGRTSTNNVSLANTHPFVKNNWTLIHNGVVQHHGDKYDMDSTCDTEHLAYNLSTGGVEAIERNITGYYAIGAISPDGKLHVIKDATAQLNIAYVENIKSYIIGTTRDIIKEVADNMKWKISPIDAVTDNVHAVFEGNNMVHQASISPRGRSSYYGGDDMDYLAAKAFGYKNERSDKWDYKNATSDWLTSEESRLTKQGGIVVNPLKEEVTKDCEIFMIDGTEIDFEDYQFLPVDERMKCTIIKSDGTWLERD